MNFKNVIVLICAFIVLVAVYVHKNNTDEQPMETIVVEDVQLEVEPVVTESTEPVEPVVTAETIPEEPVEVETPNLISLGEFRLTAYCSCSKCCGKWAANRPVDENGNEIVYGSSGEVLIAGISIATDTSIIPYGTEVIINGHTYVAHDTGSGINNKSIDVYFNDHQEACNFGLQYAEVFVKAN